MVASRCFYERRDSIACRGRGKERQRKQSEEKPKARSARRAQESADGPAASTRPHNQQSRAHSGARRARRGDQTAGTLRELGAPLHSTHATRPCGPWALPAEAGTAEAFDESARMCKRTCTLWVIQDPCLHARTQTLSPSVKNKKQIGALVLAGLRTQGGTPMFQRAQK